jgi:hypothetical protein
MKYSSVIVLAFVAAACHSAPSEADRAILASASVAPATFRVGDAATVTVTVENRGSKAVSLLTCPAWFEVLKGESVVAPGTQICAASWLGTTLEPGASYAHSFEWRGDTRALSNPPTFLDPGRYELRPAVQVESSTYRGPAVEIELTH